jgi:hypothetical protein
MAASAGFQLDFLIRRLLHSDTLPQSDVVSLPPFCDQIS